MYINVESYDDLEKLQGGALESIKNNNCIIFIRMNGCYYCDKMKKEWQSLVKEKQNDDNLDILEIERNRLDDLMRRDREFFLPKFMGIRGFPTIMLQNRNREVFPFEADRSKVNFLRFIKAHSKPLVIKKPVKIKKLTDMKKSEKKTEKKSEKKTEKKTEKKPKKKSTKGINPTNGKLKPGYKYEKGGIVTKVKKD